MVFHAEQLGGKRAPADLAAVVYISHLWRRGWQEKRTPHLQGYIMCKGAVTGKTIKKMFPVRTHLEVAKRSPQTNIIYCTKENTNIVEVGERPKQGKRRDIDDVKEALELDEPEPLKRVSEIARSMQAVRWGENWLKYHEKKRCDKPKVIWLWGPTGSGKTRWAREHYPDAWWSGKNLQWWEGYDGHATVVIDDFRPAHCEYSELLRILDRYPYTLPVKYGSRQLLAKVIVITSPLDPRTWYDGAREDVEQLIRRIDEITELKMVDDEVAEEKE